MAGFFLLLALPASLPPRIYRHLASCPPGPPILGTSRSRCLLSSPCTDKENQGPQYAKKVRLDAVEEEIWCHLWGTCKMRGTSKRQVQLSPKCHCVSGHEWWVMWKVTRKAAPVKACAVSSVHQIENPVSKQLLSASWKHLAALLTAQQWVPSAPRIMPGVINMAVNVPPDGGFLSLVLPLMPPSWALPSTTLITHSSPHWPNFCSRWILPSTWGSIPSQPHLSSAFPWQMPVLPEVSLHLFLTRVG